MSSLIMPKKRLATSGTRATSPAWNQPSSCMTDPATASWARASCATLGPSTGCSRCLVDEGGDVAEEALDVHAAGLAQLARDQVERLNVVGALVDAEDLRVAGVLLDRVVPGVADAAVHLDRHLGHAERRVRRVGLHQRREQVDLALVVEGSFVVVACERGGVVEVHGALDDQRADAFDVGLHPEQHAAHVGVLDDRHAGRVGVLPVAALGPCLRSLAYSRAFR